MAATITSISDVRRFFCRNQRPINDISATDFNLQGMDEWVANFRSICRVDCFDGRHPDVPAAGICGQYLDVDMTADVVIVTPSSLPGPLEAEVSANTRAACSAVVRTLEQA